MGTRNRLIATLGLFAVVLLFAAVEFGGIGGCGTAAAGGGGGGGGTSDSDSRGLTGALPVSIPAPLTLRGKEQTTDLACADIQVCCASYDGSITTTTVGSDCTFSLVLPLNNFSYCGLFSGEDADANGCGDEYLASLGCAENGYSGAIPIFPAADGSTDPINIATGDVEGTKFVSSGNACAQVDQDGDGTADSSDTDDDDDGTEDGEDRFNKFGCGNLHEFDSDGDHVPDLFQGFFHSQFTALLEVKYQTDSTLDQYLLDEDGDGIPDGCDKDFGSTTGCEPAEWDTDGNCIPDRFEYCSKDVDGDGLDFCFDCDDSDPDLTVSTDCYSNYCDADADGDGFGLCQDCNDRDPTVQYECFADDYCSLDKDGDGFPHCIDCDDRDASIGATECHPARTAESSATSTPVDYCDQDNDRDGFNICSDCYDFDATKTTQCYTATDVCLVDHDGDGFGFCQDCNDNDNSRWDDCSTVATPVPPQPCEEIDGDGDGFNRCNDCNDADPSMTTDCLSSDTCAIDHDGDGYGFCQDCNDNDSLHWTDCNIMTPSCNEDHDGDTFIRCLDCNDANPGITTECFTATACNVDADHDGFGFCQDCDDLNPSIGIECHGSSLTLCGTPGLDKDHDGLNFCMDCNDKNPLIPACIVP